MTITIDVPRRTQQTASAGQTAFPYGFKIFAQGDLEVFLNGLLLILTTDYTVSGIEVQTGGNVNLVVPASLNDIITINSNISDVQLTDYSVGGEFTGISIETALDKLTTSLQQINTLFNTRGLTYNVTDDLGLGDTTIPKLQDGEFWKFSVDGIKAVKGDPSPDTLRSELASQTLSSPGTGLIGVKNPRTLVGETLTDYIATETMPVDSSKAIVKSGTKEFRIGVGQISDGATRVLEMRDEDVNLIPASAAQVQVGTDNNRYMTSRSLTDGTSARLQSVESTDSTRKTTITIIPHDATAPQKTEGFEYLTVAITPKRADSKLLIEWQFSVLSENEGSDITGALFRDAATDAISANSVGLTIDNFITHTSAFLENAGTTSLTTFKLRIGKGSGTPNAVLVFNGFVGSASALFGGKNQAFLRVTEFIG